MNRGVKWSLASSISKDALILCEAQEQSLAGYMTSSSISKAALILWSALYQSLDCLFMSSSSISKAALILRSALNQSLECLFMSSSSISKAALILSRVQQNSLASLISKAALIRTMNKRRVKILSTNLKIKLKTLNKNLKSKSISSSNYRPSVCPMWILEITNSQWLGVNATQWMEPLKPIALKYFGPQNVTVVTGSY